MSTKKKSSKKKPVTLGKVIDKLKLDPNERDYQITSGVIKDMLCNYDIVITGDNNHGDTAKVNGQGIVDEDMLSAMAKFNVHLACLDDSFKVAGIEVNPQDNDGKCGFVVDGIIISNIDKMRGHELTGNYTVTGFAIKGSEGNESIILKGHKYISASDHMELKTPKIPLDQNSSYKWYNELATIAELIREEVSLYREGKYTEKEPKEKDDPQQLVLTGDALDAKLNEEGETGQQE